MRKYKNFVLKARLRIIEYKKDSDNKKITCAMSKDLKVQPGDILCIQYSAEKSHAGRSPKVEVINESNGLIKYNHLQQIYYFINSSFEFEEI